jgi:hypothetical protein
MVRGTATPRKVAEIRAADVLVSGTPKAVVQIFGLPVVFGLGTGEIKNAAIMDFLKKRDQRQRDGPRPGHRR